MYQLRRLHRWAALPRGDMWLILKAAVLLAAVRSALWSLPFPVTRRLLHSMSRPPARLTSRAMPPSPKRIGWAVSIASRAVPGATHCLTQALVTHLLLTRRGQSAELCFGVDKQSPEKFIAHAWVESNGVVVIGGPHIHRYIKLRSPPDSLAGRCLQ